MSEFLKPGRGLFSWPAAVLRFLVVALFSWDFLSASYAITFITKPLPRDGYRREMRRKQMLGGAVWSWSR